MFRDLGIMALIARTVFTTVIIGIIIITSVVIRMIRIVRSTTIVMRVTIFLLAILVINTNSNSNN